VLQVQKVNLVTMMMAIAYFRGYDDSQTFETRPGVLFTY
jgi:hypothetical protein